MSAVDQALVRELFNYDPASGRLTHRQKNTWRVQIGDEVGHTDPYGYRVTIILGKRYRLHRLIWLHQTGNWPDEFVDHIDGNRAHNAWDNLRECTRTQNAWNRRPRASAVPFKGVFPHKSKWMSRIRKHPDLIYLGTFSTPEEAAVAYDKAAIALHGEFAKTNFSLGLLPRNDGLSNERS